MTIPSVDATARKELVALTEDHLTLLVREAVSVQRHCKRARIHLPPESPGIGTTAATDNNSAFSRLHPSSHAGGGILKRRLHAEDINMALQWRGSEKIYATATAVNGSLSSSTSTKSNHPHQHKDVKKVMLEDYLKQKCI